MKFKTYEEMVEAAREAIQASSPASAVYIGCDSIRRKRRGKFYAVYATVIVLHIDGKHGGKLYSFVETQPDYGSMKQRLLNEVGYAVRAGLDLADDIGDRKFEIHIDINPDPQHKSNVARGEARGYVFGSFSMEPIFKPEAFAATYAADNLCRL